MTLDRSWPTLPYITASSMERLERDLDRISWRSTMPQEGADLRDEIEAILSARWGMTNAILSSSGIQALSLALRANGLSERDVVAVPAGVWGGISTAVTRLGGRIVYYETQKWAESISLFPPVATDEVKFVLAIHNHAMLADIRFLSSVFQNSIIIEDAPKVSATIVSFEATKPITCFEGGAVSFDSAENAKLARAWLKQDTIGYYNNHHPEMSRPAISQFSCSLLLSQLDCYDELCSRRAKGAKYLLECLGELPIKIRGSREILGLGSFYGILVETSREDPSMLINYVERQTGLVCDRHYLPYPNWNSNDPSYFIAAEEEYARGIVVPHHAFLATQSKLDGLINVLRSFST
jgi:dTDP-4-amino-4,6-dideoxygalactose transaminase